MPKQHFLLTNDKMIRSALRVTLEEQCEGHRDIKIIDELGITHGAARIDIAVVNGIIHGYELKSDSDTLFRLPNQVKIYNSVLDKVTLVVGKKHLLDAIEIVPDWWGITIAKVDDSGTVSLQKIREAEKNPEQNLKAIASLLWREEALEILEKMDMAHGVRSKTRQHIYERLSQVLELEVLTSMVRDCLRLRTNWRVDELSR